MANNSNLNFLYDIDYRKTYGKIFSFLFAKYGYAYTTQIEDAIQNAFEKSLKIKNSSQFPTNKESWLLKVAKHDLINQIKRENKTFKSLIINNTNQQNEVSFTKDLRLEAIIFIVQTEYITTQAKVLFILKNIFGLHIKEIETCTLLQTDAIYKSNKRTKTKLVSNNKDTKFDLQSYTLKDHEISTIEETLYAVFNIGFDSFQTKSNEIINEDLCLESLALTKLLLKYSDNNSTKNLISLFCFHLARIKTKHMDDKLIPFHEQDSNKWNKTFIDLGFHFLSKPNQLEKYYIEALIISNHMGSSLFDNNYWEQIICLYEQLSLITQSPVVKLNLCYCLHKASRTSEANQLLTQIEHSFPKNHFYFSLVKADIIKQHDVLSADLLMKKSIEKVGQKIRKNYIENKLI